MIMRTTLAAAALLAYTTIGMLTYAPTVANTQEACNPVPGYGSHVALWPVSYPFSTGLPSAC